MTARIDERCARQNSVDKPDVAEVIGQLIGEVLAPGTQRCGFLQIATAECGECAHRGSTHRLGIAVAVGEQVVKLVGDVDDVGQFHGALHARVTGEDLLHQRGTGARQADDEDRCGTRVTTAGDPGKERGIKECADARRAVLEMFDVERRIEPPQHIAASVMAKGVGVLLALLKGLAERELHLRQRRACYARACE